MKNARLFEGVYTLPIQVQTGVINNASTPIYFTGYPYLLKKKIKAINFNLRQGATIPQYVYFTLYNSKGEQLVYNLPASDIINSSQPANQTRLRLFDLYDIDLQKSYWIYSQNIGWIITGTIFELNFYM